MVEHHLCFFINLMGTGQADIVRFASREVNVAYNDRKLGGFLPASKLIDGFGIEAEWPSDKTIQYVANIYG